MAFKKKSTGNMTSATTATLDFGAPYLVPLRVRYDAVSDTTVTLAITDADGRTVYTDADDAVTAIDKALVYDASEGSDGTFVADQGQKIFANPLTVTLTNHDGTGYQVDVWAEV